MTWAVSVTFVERWWSPSYVTVVVASGEPSEVVSVRTSMLQSAYRGVLRQPIVEIDAMAQNETRNRFERISFSRVVVRDTVYPGSGSPWQGFLCADDRPGCSGGRYARAGAEAGKLRLRSETSRAPA